MIQKIVIDGNDGTGKTYRLNELKKIFPNIEYQDRGIFSEYTLIDELFNANSKNYIDIFYLFKDFYDTIKNNSTILYVICDCSIETSQKRILERGDSLEEEYHTKEDLQKYKNRFLKLVRICKNLPNVMLINTD